MSDLDHQMLKTRYCEHKYAFLGLSLVPLNVVS